MSRTGAAVQGEQRNRVKSVYGNYCRTTATDDAIGQSCELTGEEIKAGGLRRPQFAQPSLGPVELSHRAIADCDSPLNSTRVQLPT